MRQTHESVGVECPRCGQLIVVPLRATAEIRDAHVIARVQSADVIHLCRKSITGVPDLTDEHLVNPESD